MYLNDETTGHGPTDLTPEIDDTDLSDEALDRPGMRGADYPCGWGCRHCLGTEPALRP
jgi:hypothetical protein